MQTQRGCILVVDDDFINREVIKNVFDSHYCFVEAYNGKDALEKIESRESTFSAILLDVNMPVMNGIELLRILSERGIPQEIPVFLVTAEDEFDVAKEAYQLGVMDVINKPITPFIILRRVQSVIELFEARKALNAKLRYQEKKLKESSDTIDALHKGTIEALASAIEFRDVESGEHTNRIYGITKHILTYTDMGEGFTPDDIENIAIGSIMHDIGKISISDVILNKPGKLTPAEFEVMKGHTIKGGELMEQLTKTQSHPAYTYACDIARHHHERWDGRGYPDKLCGDEITIWSQVVSIADVYDALLSPRVYKKAYDPDKAVDMIKNGECGIFNPKLVEAFLQVEPEMRKWYENDRKELESKAKNKGEDAFSMPQPAEEVVNVLLLMAAVESAYDMIISVNLTKNIYKMINYDRFLTHAADYDGVFDDLIASGAATIPSPDKERFVDVFSREKLIEAYKSGKTAVSLVHKQFSDTGVLHMVETTVLLTKDTRNGDILQITLARYLNDD